MLQELNNFINIFKNFLGNQLNSLFSHLFVKGGGAQDLSDHLQKCTGSAVFSGGAGGARAPPEFGGSQKGQSLISAYQSLAITTNTPGFEKLNTALSMGPTKIGRNFRK